MNIFVVMGQTGEHDDVLIWSVMAHFNEEKAQEHVLKASARFKEIWDEHLSIPGNDVYDVPRDKNEYDPGMIVEYTGVSYLYEKVALSPEAEKIIINREYLLKLNRELEEQAWDADKHWSTER